MPRADDYDGNHNDNNDDYNNNNNNDDYYGVGILLGISWLRSLEAVRRLLPESRWGHAWMLPCGDASQNDDYPPFSRG